MKRSNNGFTLIELLAVIVIMGILMLVAIPAISRVIENSRKDTFVDITKSYVNATRTLWTTDGLTCEGKVSSAVDDGDYYILINTKESARSSLPVLLDQGGKSSWGNRDVNGYVRVNVATIPGKDSDGDGIYETEPKRVTKFYAALSDGTHGIIDDNTLTSDELVRGNVKMNLSADDLKKIQLTVDDGKLDCVKDAIGIYSCTAVWPVNNITGICVDVTGRVETIGSDFSTDEWSTVIRALKSGAHPYQVGDSKTVDMGSLGTHTIRIANLSTPNKCSQENFSQTACGVVLEFADIITNQKMNSLGTNVGGWPAAEMRTYINNNIYNALPSELQSAIISTKVVSGHGLTAGETNFTSTDKLYLLSTAEVWEGGTSYDTARTLTRQLDYYANIGVTTSNNSGARKKYDGTNEWWWLRTANSIDTIPFFNVLDYGSLNNSTAANPLGVSPAFRIA